MFDYPILSILIWLPILVGLILVASNDIGKSLSTVITLLTTLIILIISIKLFQSYDYSLGNLQFIERIVWISGLNIFYYLGVDGISV